jgi:hypothetical protein
MDVNGKLPEQMEENVDLVIVINEIDANPEDVDLFLKEWALGTEIINRHLGFLST